MNTKFTRRNFITTGTVGALSVLAIDMLKQQELKAGELTVSKPLANSKVVQIRNTQASIVEGSKKRYPVNQTVVQSMLDDSIVALTDITDKGEAWKSIFPGITSSSKICIKINCIASGGGPYVTANSNAVSTRPEVIYALVNCLATMQFDGQGYNVNNITIFDRADVEMINAGYSINKSDTGVKCYGTREGVSSGSADGSGTTKYSINGSTQYLSKIFEESNYMINVSVLKDHSFAGATICLKNNYGVIHMPECSQMHNTSTAVSLLNSIAPIKQKQVLCIIDGIYGIKSGGPEGYPQFTADSILMSKDPVAIDTIGVNILLENGMSKQKVPSYLKNCSNAGLGNYLPENIDVIKLGSVAIGENNFNEENLNIFSNYPNPFKDNTTLSFQLFNPAYVKISVFDLNGRLISKLCNKHFDAGYHRLTWNAGNIKSGTYLARIDIDDLQRTIKMQCI